MFDEEGAAPGLAREIAAAFAGRRYEMIFVDDRSRDATRHVLTTLKSELPTLRVLTHQTNSGQSRALRSGILNARGAVIVTLDGDGQNDPADGPKLVDALVVLFIELLKSTTSHRVVIINHALSMMLFVACLVEFLLAPAFATSTFFLLTLMVVLDVLAGFIVTIASTRRDIDFNDRG